MKKYNDERIYPKEWTTKKLKSWIDCYYNTMIKHDRVSQDNEDLIDGNTDDIEYYLTLISELRNRGVGVTTKIRFY